MLLNVLVRKGVPAFRPDEVGPDALAADVSGLKPATLDRLC